MARFWDAVLASVVLAGCAAPVVLPPVPAYSAAVLRPMTLKAVLVAGDGSITAFDTAADRMDALLLASGRVAAADVRRLSSAPGVVARPGVATASRDRVLDAVASMHPGPGQGCLVFATSHGVARQGLYLAPYREVLTPDALDRALAEGCGNAPTVVVASSCFSGMFARGAMARANRIVLTAARPDRVSFGCGAQNEMTDYDACLLEALGAPGDRTWQEAYAAIVPCVSAREARGRFPPSAPQAWFGPAVADMVLPGRS